MAKTEKTKSLERTYNIPLRKEYQKVPHWKRTKKAVTATKQFLQKHMKSEQVKLGKHLNEELWKHGIRNPPHHIKVTSIKDDKGIVRAELFGQKIDFGEKEKKKKPSKLQEIAKKAGIKVPDKKEEPKTEEKPKEESQIEEKKEEVEEKKAETEEKKEEVKTKEKAEEKPTEKPEESKQK